MRRKREGYGSNRAWGRGSSKAVFVVVVIMTMAMMMLRVWCSLRSRRLPASSWLFASRASSFLSRPHITPTATHAPYLR